MRNEDCDFAMARSYFPNSVWFRGKPRRIKRPAEPSIAELRQALREQQGLTLYWESKARKAEEKLAEVQGRRAPRPQTPFRGIPEVKST